MTDTKKSKPPVKNSSSKKKEPVKKVVKPKIDYKKKYEETKKENIRLNGKIKELVFENNKNIGAFQDKAKGFQSKAQDEINKVKNELRAKAEADAVENKKYGAQKLLENILDPITNIDLAIEAGQKQEDAGVKAYVQGFKMLMGQLFNELEAYGITIIAPKVGDEYDPKQHQAFSAVAGKDSNTIQSLKKKGFKLHDRVVKPAVVIVVK